MSYKKKGLQAQYGIKIKISKQCVNLSVAFFMRNGRKDLKPIKKENGIKQNKF